MQGPEQKAELSLGPRTLHSCTVPSLLSRLHCRSKPLLRCQTPGTLSWAGAAAQPQPQPALPRLFWQPELAAHAGRARPQHARGWPPRCRCQPQSAASASWACSAAAGVAAWPACCAAATRRLLQGADSQHQLRGMRPWTRRVRQPVCNPQPWPPGAPSLLRGPLAGLPLRQLRVGLAAGELAPSAGTP